MNINVSVAGYENELSHLAQPINSTKFKKKKLKLCFSVHSDGLLFSDGWLRDGALLLVHCGYNTRSHFVMIRT